MWRNLLYKLFPRNKPTVVVIAGPTASGKTACSLALAQALSLQGRQAEIISADSRQVYREIPIFSAAVQQEEMQDIPHHLVGTETVDRELTAQWFADTARHLIEEIHQRGNVPIVVGGSAFWIERLLYEDTYPQVPPNEELRAELGGLGLDELRSRLKGLDSKYYQRVDTENPRRLMRGIEIAEALGEVPRVQPRLNNKWKIEFICLNLPAEDHKPRVAESVRSRFARGLISEAKELSNSISIERMQELGLVYKHVHEYWSGNISQEQLIKRAIQEEQRYAKRQRTFFNKMIRNFPLQVHSVRSSLEVPRLIERISEDII